ncbi:MAG: hypothetical protein H6733_09760 [Alphaproteobacteria bacterium]|nr:hypothetical protein [Alphaproteobacteria bacterium]
MTRTLWLSSLSLLATVAVSAVAADGPTASTSEIPVVPMDDGQGVHALVAARPFALTAGKLTYDHAADHAAITDGTVVVVAVDDALAVARDAKSPVLYAGALPVQVVTRQSHPGCIVGLLPPEVDLASAPLFFGSYEPPERVDVARGEAELAAARALGIGPRDAVELRDASERGGARLTVADDAALYAAARAAVSACPH